MWIELKEYENVVLGAYYFRNELSLIEHPEYWVAGDHAVTLALCKMVLQSGLYNLSINHYSVALVAIPLLPTTLLPRAW